jgi:sirohydrochlorin cobaltochelatase
MSDSIETTLAAALTGSTAIGQIRIERMSAGGFVLSHRDDTAEVALENFRHPEDAIAIARFDDAGNYRPLKTAPNLRHGWRLEAVDLDELRRALDYFYPGRLAMLTTWKQGRLTATTLRDTLNRQSGMYRVAAKISDEQVDNLVGGFCRSNGGCMRTILWNRDASGAGWSTKLQPEKFDPVHDQTGKNEHAIPLICQEACNLLVAECRKIVKGETNE